MNMPAAESIGLPSILDVLAPSAAVLDDAPAEMSFDAMLNEPTHRLPSCPLPDRQEPQLQKQQSFLRDAHLAADDGMSGTAEETKSEDEPAIRSELDEQPSDHEEDESDRTEAVVVVPTAIPVTLAAVEQAGEATQAEAETTAQSAGKFVSTAATAAAAAIKPVQPIVATGVVASADSEAATGQPSDEFTRHAARRGAGASNIDEVEPDTLTGISHDPSRPVLAAKKRPSPDEDAEPNRDPGQPAKHQAENFSEIPIGGDSAAAVDAAGRNAEAPGLSVPAVETTSTAILASPNTPLQQSLAQRLQPELLSTATGHVTRDSDTPLVDSARLLNRVARAFVTARDGSGEVRLRLSPPELGALRLEIKVLDGALVARLETETSSARTVLIENLPALRERLAEQGVRIERFDVDLMQRHSGGAFDRPANQQPQDQPPQPQFTERPRRLPQVAEGVVARATIIGLDQRRLNVIV
jgi:flagellar hook-length control protein FliK